MRDLPDKATILAWITENPGQTSKRDIAKAFGIKGAQRIDLKRILKELEEDGVLEKRRKTYRDPDKLPPVSVLQVLAPDQLGDLFARPMEWQGDGPEPRVYLILRQADPTLGEGDRILARLSEVNTDQFEYEARLIRKIGTNPRKILAVFRKSTEGGRLVPIEKSSDKEWRVEDGAAMGARDGELVEAEQAGPKNRPGLPRARIIARLGDPSAPRAVSLIAIHQHGIPDQFSDAAIAEADRAKPAGLAGRVDLTGRKLVTIDPGDARDHDDACLAVPDDAKDNEGGFHLWVAIADVGHYVRPGSALDRDALERGNSTYFPDRVVAMLPDRLSGDLCSLHEGVPRACVAVEMRIDKDGRLLSHQFHRALMKSAASLNYQEVQDAADGSPNERCATLLEDVIEPLYGAYKALARARAKRQPLELDLPERQIVLDPSGRVMSVAIKDRLDAHRMIEEFMILANVAAARTLEKNQTPLIYRVHEEPSPEKLDALREVAHSAGLVLAKGQVLKTEHLNRLLEAAEGSDHADLINLSTLRAMTQAYYSPSNFGHFGLALRSYAHFTSPIRRYSDLIVHRALIKAHGWGDDGLGESEIERLETTATHISETERRSMVAERDTTDRYLASYLSERVGTEITGRVSGIQRFGVFVKLDETGADGLVPVRSIGNEYFHFDADTQTLMGSDTGMTIGLGQPVLVRIAEAVPVTGGLLLDLIEIGGKTLSTVRRHNRRGVASRRNSVTRKPKKSVTRTRRKR